MKTQLKFQRHELKYYLPEELYPELMRLIRPYMNTDPHLMESGNKSYTVNESSGKYYCYKVNSGLFSSDDKVGEARSLEDALSVIKSHASKWGTVYSVNIG